MFENIQIPQEFLPTDGRFGSGPSLVRPESLVELAEIQKTYLGTSHRKPAVKDRIGNILHLMREYLKIPAGHKIAMGNGSASLVWDMATFSLIEKKSIHFVNGEFSNKWYQSAEKSPFVDTELVKVENGQLPEFHEDSSADVHCITWNETSTGAMFPESPKCENSLLAVDATSAVGALDWDLSKSDLFFFSPQKAFGSDGGLWIAFFSERCVEQIEQVKKSGRYIPVMLDFTTALKNGESNQTYNTPALCTLFLLEKQLEWFMAQGGLSAIDKMQQEKVALLENWVNSRSELSFYIEQNSARSKTVSTINIIDEIPYQDLTKQLRMQGILDIDCYRKLGKNQIRISLFPNIIKSDLEKLTQSIDYLFDHR